MPFKTIVSSLAMLALAATLAKAGPGHIGGDWRAELAKVEAKLQAGKWKACKRDAHELAEEILFHGWHDRELGKILAELAFFQAIANANLDRKDEAVWYWHLAQNVYFRIRKKDLTPYGEAGELLREFPLRQKGQAPASFQIAERDYGRFIGAVKSKEWSPTIPNSAAAHSERPGDVPIELIIDRHGQPHHPVILTTDVHPTLIYGLLDALRTMPRLEPARYSGEPVDSLFKYIISPTYDRWDQGGNTFGGKVRNR